MDKAELIAQSYPFNPTKEQLIFCSAMAGFLSQELNHQCFILRGYAGTGKTTSVAALVKALPKFKIRSVLMAPTGRAAKVISSYTGKKALTIHKRIYRKKSAVSAEMSFQLAPNLAEHTLFIVDEASMVADEWNTQTGSSFLKDLMEYAYNQKNCAVLFVGDTAQLPPVGSIESPALNKDYLSNKFGMRVSEIELKEVVRQEKKSGILANATMLRKRINEKSKDINEKNEHINQKNEGLNKKVDDLNASNENAPEAKLRLPKFLTKNYKDIFRMTGTKLVEGLEYAYNKFGIENSLVVCRSNKSANMYNQQIRSRLLYRDEELTGGDQIMVVRNNYFWLPENETVSFIANGDMARITRVRGTEERYGLRFCEAQLIFLDFPDVGEITCKVLLDTLHTETPNLPYEQSNKMFEELNIDYEHISNKRERLLAIKEDPYYNALQIKFAYAVTCHKAQGGQWDAVFVDQGYLTEDMIDLDFLRWLYTGVTRAKKELFLVNFAQNLYTSAAEEEF